MRAALFQIVFVVAYAVVSYFLLPLVWSAFPTNPFSVTAFFLLWAGLLALILPIPLRWYMILSSILIGGLIIIGLYQGYQLRLPLFTQELLVLWGIVAFALIVAWLMIAPRLWRHVKGIVVVSQSPEDHHD